MKPSPSFALALLIAFAAHSSPAAEVSTSQTQLPAESAPFGAVIDGKFSALLQTWAVGNSAVTRSDQAFRLRRAELKLGGSIAKAPRYFFMIDPAKLIKPVGSTKAIPTSTMIQDFGLSYTVASAVELTVGQFKIPTMAEGLDSSGDLPLPERSLVGRTIGDKRELGARVAYKGENFKAASMLSMARPISVDGPSELRDFITRVDYSPVKDLSIGTFTLLRDFDYSSKGRYGFNARYSANQAVLRAEFAQARDGGVQSRGLNLEAGYWLTESLEPIARFEVYHPGQSSVFTGRAETLGLTYLLSKLNARIQVAGSLLQNMSGGNGTPTLAKGTTDRVLTVALQGTI